MASHLLVFNEKNNCFPPFEYRKDFFHTFKNQKQKVKKIKNKKKKKKKKKKKC